MEFSLDSSNSQYIIRACDADKVIVNDKEITQNFIITPQKLIYPWNSNDFEALLEGSPQIILLGTGVHFSIISPEKLSIFYQHHIGIEVMNTPSACRTFNVLASEGRRVAAGIVVK